MIVKKGKGKADSWKITSKNKSTGKRERQVFSVIFHLFHILSFILLVEDLVKLLVPKKKNCLPVSVTSNFLKFFTLG